MKEKVHEHLLAELALASRSNTTFVISAVLFNIFVLVFSSAIAAINNPFSITIFGLLVVSSGIMTTTALKALDKGKQSCDLYHESLLKLYRDSHVSEYWPEAIDGNIEERGNLHERVVVVIGTIAIVIPLLSKLAFF